jgi:hypothetical protein
MRVKMALCFVDLLWFLDTFDASGDEENGDWILVEKNLL